MFLTVLDLLGFLFFFLFLFRDRETYGEGVGVLVGEGLVDLLFRGRGSIISPILIVVVLPLRG